MRPKELKDLVVSALVLALAFGIATSGGFRGFEEPVVLVFRTGVALVAVSLGFVFHELAHRLVARRFSCFAEYVMWPTGLMLALAFSVLGFVFAAPGAVMIYDTTSPWGTASLSKGRVGLISLAGPAANMGLAIVFLVLGATIEPVALFVVGARVNAWLALFNLIPFGPLDGAKIFTWSKRSWLFASAGAGVLFVAQHFLL